MNKKTKTIIITAVIIIILALLIIPKLSSSSGSADDSAASAGSGPIPVTVHIVKPQKLDNRILTTGTIMANEEVELKTETSGKVVKILFKEGTQVKKGDLLVKINDEELQAQLSRAKSALNLAEDNAHRFKLLLEREGVSQQEYDAAMNELNARKADVQLYEAQIAKTEVRAPFDGVVGLRNISEGDYVTTSTDIASMQDVDPIKIDFSIPEKYASYTNTGDKIEFTISGSDKTYIGKVYAIEPKVDENTRTLQMRAVCPNTKNEIHPGSFADVTLILEEISNALMVPSQAIIPILKGQKVFLYKSGVVQESVVKIGIRTDKMVEIIDGISPMDTVVTSGILQVGQGVPVTISGTN
jgi:membrane fusion protein (multidrug efflux system)